MLKDSLDLGSACSVTFARFDNVRSLLHVLFFCLSTVCKFQLSWLAFDDQPACYMRL